MAIFSPTSGKRSIHAGGIGKWISFSDFAHSWMLSEYSTIVLTASQNGTTNTSSIAIVIVTTATQRRRPKACSILSITGQVAMTIIAAQMMGTMKGRMIQNEATISVTMNSTPKVTCARSRRIGESPGTMGFMGRCERRASAPVGGFTPAAAARGIAGAGHAGPPVL